MHAYMSVRMCVHISVFACDLMNFTDEEAVDFWGTTQVEGPRTKEL